MERYNATRATNGKFRREHIVVWEQANGPIPKGYVIHHKNGDGHDNRLENLMMLTNEEHLKLHHELRRSGKDPVDPNAPDVIRDRERQRLSHAKYRESHREQIKEYYRTHRDEAIARVQTYYKANRKEIYAKTRAYVAAHKEETAKYQREYREKHREEKIAYDKEYRKSHREEVALSKKIWYSIKKGKPADEILRLQYLLKKIKENRK